MKKHISIMLITAMGILFSCKKKDGTDSPGTDYVTFIKYKAWWGMLTNAGETAQYFSIYFNADNSLIWSQRAGEFTGTWSIKDKQLTMNFVMPALQIKADIANDSTLKNIVTTNSTLVNSCEMIANPNIPLDNTVWNGMITSAGGTQEILQFRFMPGSRLEPKIANTTYGPEFYARSSSGAVIRFTLGVYPFFGVVISDNTMKGNYSTTATNYHLWQITKQ